MMTWDVEYGKQKTDLGYDLTQSSNMQLLKTNFKMLQDCTRKFMNKVYFEQVEDGRGDGAGAGVPLSFSYVQIPFPEEKFNHF